MGARRQGPGLSRGRGDEGNEAQRGKSYSGRDATLRVRSGAPAAGDVLQGEGLSRPGRQAAPSAGPQPAGRLAAPHAAPLTLLRRGQDTRGTQCKKRQQKHVRRVKTPSNHYRKP